MPYINDVLAKNNQTNRENALKKAQQQKRLSRFLFDPDAVAEHINNQVIGQAGLHRTLAEILHIVKADFSPANRPLCVCLFLGPTGVGKTETVRLLGETLLGSADAVCRIDMNTLAQEHYMAALTGAPPGYVGSKENHTLFDIDNIQGSYSKPGIVLFDEVEKASKEVIRSLLNVLDTGFLALPSGNKTIDFRNAMIFMTSNLGVKSLSAYRSGFEKGYKQWLGIKPSAHTEAKLLDAALCREFDPEFINRIDHTIIFNAIEKNTLGNIFDLQIQQINQRLKKSGVSISVDQTAKDFILQSYDSRYGARDVARHINQQLNSSIARELNSDGVFRQLHVSFIGGELSIDKINPL